MLVRGIIRDLKARGTTVFLNSHLLGEVEATCDRVTFIREGRVLRTLSLRDMAIGQIQVELRVDSVTPDLITALQQIDNTVLQHATDDPAPSVANGPVTVSTVVPATMIELTVADEEQLPLIAERVLASGARLYALTPRRLSLEQLFLDIVGTQDSGQ
jgi:ABC-2 type transport system ATP-binding protein